MGAISTYIDQFGYIVLFTTLMLELIALPLPGQALMIYAGFLVHQGQFHWATSILVAGFGSCVGMTITYFIGSKLGSQWIKNYGHIFNLKPNRWEKTAKWFSKYGNIVLIFGYYIPGVRHFTGYFSGITMLSFRSFMIFAYSGAFIWTSVFISMGKFLGPEWDQLTNKAKIYIFIGLLIASFIIIIIFLYKNVKFRVKN